MCQQRGRGSRAHPSVHAYRASTGIGGLCSPTGARYGTAVDSQEGWPASQAAGRARSGALGFRGGVGARSMKTGKRSVCPRVCPPGLSRVDASKGLAASLCRINSISLGVSPFPCLNHVDRSISPTAALYLCRGLAPHCHSRRDRHPDYAGRYLPLYRYPRGQHSLELQRPFARRDGKADGHHLRAGHDHHRQRHRTYRVPVLYGRWLERASRITLPDQFDIIRC